jgi:hypothetical protein
MLKRTILKTKIHYTTTKGICKTTVGMSSAAACKKQKARAEIITTSPFECFYLGL